VKEKPEDRVERIVRDMMRGRRLKLRGGDAEEKEAITAAAQLAAARQGPQRMHPAFRRRLAEALESAPRGSWMTRRAALVAGLGVATGALTGGAIARALEPAAAPTARVGGQTVNPTRGRWIDVGALADFGEGQGKLVHAGAVGAFVFRRNTTVSAVSSMCSHLPCELWWDSSGALLDCPCHPVSFKADGSPASNAYPMPSLSKVQSRVTDAGRVELLGA
jgi:nitrite reductase/ring-hydroxylating ferredoxin subunit